MKAITPEAILLQSPTVLIVDDDPSMTSVVSEVLRTNGLQTVAAIAPESAIALFQEHNIDLVLTDIEMPEGKASGFQLLREIKDLDPQMPVIMLTGQATKERAVAALRAGAQDFIEKPFPVDELVQRVNNALLQRKGQRALAENIQLKRQLKEKFAFDNIVGQSPVMQDTYRMLQRIAPTDSAVLIRGESGTGKELIARALHYNSRRATGPFVAVNCAAMPEQLLESELFGHRKGAFTGAVFDKVGLFQSAQSGTILLDEIGSMPLALQSKLLRFLQDKELRRVGDTQMIKVDVRVLAATNEPLEARIAKKEFREDLFYRLNVISVTLPSLRERTDDIPLLAAHFIQLNQPQAQLTPAALERLTAYRWPGNVRELQNAIERACAMCEDGVIQPQDLPETVRQNQVTKSGVSAEIVPLRDYVHEAEVGYIRRAIEFAGDNRTKAARLLNVSVATLYRKLGDELIPAGQSS